MGEGLMVLLELGTVATLSMILFPIVLAAAIAHSIIKGDARRKSLVSGMVAFACAGIAAILVFNSKLMSDKRAAAIDERRALQLARESKVIANAVGGVIKDIRIASITDERLNRGFDVFAYRRESNMASYHMEANGTVGRSARVVLRYGNGERIFELECCQHPSTWSTPAPPPTPLPD
jgi:tetrahydromethanopterin S-methyltransferase subunit C